MTAPVRVGTAEALDGAVLAFRADGEGPALICANGLGMPAILWRKLADHFAPTHTVVTWDYRGYGRSPVPEHPEGVTVAQCARDLWSVADRAGVEEAVLLGHSMGAQVCLEAYRVQPRRVRALVPVLGAAGASLGGGARALPLVRVLLEAGAANAGLAGQALRAVLRVPGVWTAICALGIVHPDLCSREDFEPWLEHLRTLDLRVYFALARDLLSHDPGSMLSEVRVPTLVIAGERDAVARAERPREMAAQIPGAELLVVRGSAHAALLEQPELVALAVEKFLRVRGLA